MDKQENQVSPAIVAYKSERRQAWVDIVPQISSNRHKLEMEALTTNLPTVPTAMTSGSPAPTIVEKPEVDDSKTIAPEPSSFAQLGSLQKNILLAIFCLGQFMDIMNTSAMLPALPATSQTVGLTESDSVWLFAAYQATFASFLLISGRISDIYGPKPAFILGSLFFGGTSLGAGFLNNRIALLVLRALQGIGAAHTIPSALSMIVQMMPEPKEQQRAIGLFGASGAVANGTIIGAILVEYASWRWIFWIIAIISIPAAAACVFLIPSSPRNNKAKASQLDALGVFILIAAIVLFVYALTTGSVSGWRSGGVLAPFFVSIALFLAFFFWEARVDEANAALPPKLWFYPNFAVLFGTALMPFFWYMQMYLTFSPYWQDYLNWSTIITGVKFLPLGVVAGPIMVNGGRIAAIGRPKLLIMGGLILAFIATIMLPFSSQLNDRYWPLVFPAFIIGSAGTAVVFVLANISIFQTTPPAYAGTVGAVFNAALQLGGAIGSSATTSIQTSIDEKVIEDGSFDGTHFQGRSASLWFLLAWVGLVAIGVAVFYKQGRRPDDVEGKPEDDRPIAIH
ncbi:major facilitator superfamily transporter [Rhizoctonia solani]|uniref:Major facilitator superfamily transporter n=1 Tax=Rhizoctonia solani TaxID=456999 RepID=A0A8H8T0V5_9AGAM|nr:major facilitator superfamily transporter [Rhizoctonia solani]QRW24729.1 major facilitator superfamily transporter [Rhizoctonia solani]